MRKTIVGMVILGFLITGCSSSEKDTRTLNDFFKAFEAKGSLNSGEAQYQHVNAIDGIVFNLDGNIVSIYEFKSEKDLKAAKDTKEEMKDWPSSGVFLLETDLDKAVDIFNSVK